MKTLPPALLTAQQAPAGRPLARAGLADNGRLHPVPLFTAPYTGGAVFAAHCDSFYLRLRYTASGLDTLERQRVTDPAVEAEWETWTGFETNVIGPRGAAVFWTGSYVVALWQDATDRHLYYRRSLDGLTWSSAVLAHNTLAPYAASLWGVSGGAAQSGALLYFNGGLYWCAYDPAADAWAAPESSGLSFDPAFNLEVTGFYDPAHSRHVILTNPVGYFAWARFALVVLARTGPGSYTAPRPYYHAHRNNYQQLSASPAPLGGYWWLAFHRARGWGAGVYWLAASADGLFFEDAVPTDLPPEPRLALLPPLTGRADAYLATERCVYVSTPPAHWSQAVVVRYTLSAALSAAASLTLLLDNRHSTLTPPPLYATLTLQRGYQLDAGDYVVDAGAFTVTGYRYLAGDQLLELTAVDAAGLPAAWVADQTFSFKGERLDTLVQVVLALAGVHGVTFDSHPLWAVTLDTFTVPAGATGRAALDSLAQRAPFELVINEDGTARAFIPAAAPSSAYTYGPGGHACWPGHFGEQAAPNFIAAIGSPPHLSAADAFTPAVLSAAGRRLTRLRPDPRLADVPAAEALAAALLLAQRERARAGQFDSPPNFALEPGDVIAFTGPAQAAALGPWRVERMEERFNVDRQRPFYQRVTLRGTG